MWRPIAELDPILGRNYVVRWRNGEWGVSMWKTNSRWEKDAAMLRTHPQPYFGDTCEYDDYDMALPENAPTHYIDIESITQEFDKRALDRVEHDCTA